jgi:hypothetical protein
LAGAEVEAEIEIEIEVEVEEVISSPVFALNRHPSISLAAKKARLERRVDAQLRVQRGIARCGARRSLLS